MYLTCLFICLYLRIDLKLFFKRSFVLLATLKKNEMVEKDNFEKKGEICILLYKHSG